MRVSDLKEGMMITFSNGEEAKCLKVYKKKDDHNRYVYQVLWDREVKITDQHLPLTDATFFNDGSFHSMSGAIYLSLTNTVSIASFEKEPLNLATITKDSVVEFSNGISATCIGCIPCRDEETQKVIYLVALLGKYRISPTFSQHRFAFYNPDGSYHSLTGKSQVTTAYNAPSIVGIITPSEPQAIEQTESEPELTNLSSGSLVADSSGKVYFMQKEHKQNEVVLSFKEANISNIPFKI